MVAMESLFKLSENRLIEKIQRGDSLAFRELFDHYWEPLYRRAYYRLQDSALAEDLVQDVLADLWEQRKGLRIHSGLSNYLFSMLKYKIIYWASQQDRQHQIQNHLMHRMEEMEETILGTIEAGALQQTIVEVVETFPENMRKIFLLRMQDYKIADIAHTLQLAEQTVKNNHTEALSRLKLKLSKEYPHLPIYSLLAVLFTKS